MSSDLETTGRQLKKIIPELNKLRGKGYFTRNLCETKQIFQPHNGVRIDAIREHIEKQDYDENLKAVLLVSLMEAADRRFYNWYKWLISKMGETVLQRSPVTYARSHRAASK